MTKKKPAPRPKAGAPILLLVAAGALVLVVVGALLASARPGAEPASGGVPQLAVEPEKFDFGDVAMEQPVTARFVVRNDGDGDLQILGQPQVRLLDGC